MTVGAIITGRGGSHLAQFLLEKGSEPYGIRSAALRLMLGGDAAPPFQSCTAPEAACLFAPD
jgi:hypothetical protein